MAEIINNLNENLNLFIQVRTIDINNVNSFIQLILENVVILKFKFTIANEASSIIIDLKYINGVDYI